MSLKAVELQIAVPRTSEAGKYYSESQQRPMNDQALLGQKTALETENMRQRSGAIDQSAETFVGERQTGEKSRDSSQQSRSRSDETELLKEHPAEHPYKGHHIDFSL
ncbi:hypothetical protein G9G63_05040 [Paenibacillus sp. EKM202P]|uniref:hypothetical protein n=1 Tax=unclassified Paenibacillus TaxID=185978 RepID=UPI0013EBFA3A|nr:MULTISPECIES: hypothetical protein [unclassified Paenibacillus]KAF6566757.1 hypothetical protein G9G63_05040 [Paenibacillus sp. EKM202P]KAF6572003.1 hypothetical protein G9G64_04215 [Paenibacillus sp. EKM207P]